MPELDGVILVHRGDQSGVQTQKMLPLDSNHLMNRTCRHIQRSPLCLLLYGAAILLLVLGWGVRTEPVMHWIFPVAC